MVIPQRRFKHGGGQNDATGVYDHRFRRNYLVPVPEVETLQELNELIAQTEQIEDSGRIGARIRTIGQGFATEAELRW